MTKDECRKIFRKKRSSLTWQDLQKSDDLLLIQFQKIDLPFVDYVHTYLPVESENEIDTSAAIRYLRFRNPGIITLVPRLLGDNGIFEQVAVDDETEMRDNRYGIPEPIEGKVVPAEDTDIVLVPLLAFDEKGFRVGYGKGYYDRFLENCRPDVIKIGFSYFDPVESIDDVNSYDIPLNYCVTPFRLFSFDQAR